MYTYAYSINVGHVPGGGEGERLGVPAAVLDGLEREFAPEARARGDRTPAFGAHRVQQFARQPLVNGETASAHEGHQVPLLRARITFHIKVYTS